MLRFFIGANNETGEVEIDKVRELFDIEFAGYTITEAQGRWTGKNEKSIIVDVQPMGWIVTRDMTRVEHLVEVLKEELKQESIGLQILPDITFY